MRDWTYQYAKLPQLHYQMSKDTNNKSSKYLGLSNLGINLKKKAEKLSFFSRFRLAVRAKQVVLLWPQNSLSISMVFRTSLSPYSSYLHTDIFITWFSKPINQSSTNINCVSFYSNFKFTSTFFPILNPISNFICTFALDFLINSAWFSVFIILYSLMRLSVEHCGRCNTVRTLLRFIISISKGMNKD